MCYLEIDAIIVLSKTNQYMSLRKIVFIFILSPKKSIKVKTFF